MATTQIKTPDEIMGQRISNVTAIRTYISHNSREVTLAELRDLTGDEREELGALCADAMDCTIETK